MYEYKVYTAPYSSIEEILLHEVSFSLELEEGWRIHSYSTHGWDVVTTGVLLERKLDGG